MVSMLPGVSLADDSIKAGSAMARQIADYGSEQFLVNMLYVLRKSLGTGPTSSDSE